MKIVTCSIRGRKHSERNEPCEDSVYYLQDSDVMTVSVADGAGSSKYKNAKYGAATVTKAMCDFMTQKFDMFFESTNELELRQVIQAVCHKALKECATDMGEESIETFASTLLCVSVKGNKAIAVQIGDGLVGRAFHGELEPLTMPQNGEYASSTFFINSGDAYQMIQIRKVFLNDTSHLYLMSDGIADCMYNDFNGEFNESLKQILSLLDKDDAEEKMHKVITECIVEPDAMSDDCTIAVVALKPERELKIHKVHNNTEVQRVETEMLEETEKESELTTEQEVKKMDTKERETKKATISKKLLLVVISVILLLGVFVGGFVFVGKETNENEKASNAEGSTTSVVSAETSGKVSSE